jgi:hypothetical protein
MKRFDKDPEFRLLKQICKVGKNKKARKKQAKRDRCGGSKFPKNLAFGQLGEMMKKREKGT